MTFIFIIGSILNRILQLTSTGIVTDDEMAFLQAALASTRSPLSSSSLLFWSPSRLPLFFSLPSALFPARRPVTSTRSRPSSPLKDIEDSEKLTRPKSYLERFRAHRWLSVTDLTSTEWCQKQKELELIHGKPEKTPAMEAGSKRHKELEKEVIERIEIHIVPTTERRQCTGINGDRNAQHHQVFD